MQNSFHLWPLRWSSTAILVCPLSLTLPKEYQPQCWWIWRSQTCLSFKMSVILIFLDISLSQTFTFWKYTKIYNKIIVTNTQSIQCNIPRSHFSCIALVAVRGGLDRKLASNWTCAMDNCCIWKSPLCTSNALLAWSVFALCTAHYLVYSQRVSGGFPTRCTVLSGVLATLCSAKFALYYVWLSFKLHWTVWTAEP